MGLDDASIFTRVVECHSFTQAAQLLGMQKSTVSRRIALLEDRLGVRLLNRTTRKLRLTEVGQAYYERCRQIMIDFAEAEQAVMQLQLEPAGQLKITASIEFGQLLLGPVLGAFLSQYPQISAEVEVTSRHVDPVEEGVDIAIMVGQPQDSTLIARKLLETPRRLYASPAYLATYGHPQKSTDLLGHRAIMLGMDNARYWPLLGEHLSCQCVLACNNVTLAREVAIGGAGIAALPYVICSDAVARGELVELLPEAKLASGELFAVYPSRRFQAMKVRAFLDFIIQQIETDEGGLLEQLRGRLLPSAP